jgi:hypothetical protein
MQSKLSYVYDCKITATYKKFNRPVFITENVVSEVLVYPNPTTGELRIEGAGQVRNDSKLQIINVEVLDVYGRKLIEQKKKKRKEKGEGNRYFKFAGWNLFCKNLYRSRNNNEKNY